MLIWLWNLRFDPINLKTKKKWSDISHSTEPNRKIIHLSQQVIFFLQSPSPILCHMYKCMKHWIRIYPLSRWFAFRQRCEETLLLHHATDIFPLLYPSIAFIFLLSHLWLVSLFICSFKINPHHQLSLCSCSSTLFSFCQFQLLGCSLNSIMMKVVLATD